MAPSLRSVGAAALACVGSVSAKQWYLYDTYDATNFFDKFTFFSDADPNSGHVVYKSQSEATSLGLAKYEDNEVYLGPDSTNVLDEDTGRPSVRLQSATTYNHGLFIARFSHLPQSACGAWPAFWTVGNDWPDDGEIDIIEGWNLQTTNAPAFHTGDSDEFGVCTLDGSDQSATVDTTNCDNTYSGDDQSTNEGCTATDSSAPYGSSDGGVYALEWTDSYIKLFAWDWDSVPSNIDSDEPDTSSWGTANMYLKNDNCDIDNHFIDQTLIINIAFCGNPVGNTDVWAEACKSSTGYDTCAAYVSAVPADFADTYFKIQDIRYFKTTKSASSSSSAVASSVSTTPVATAASTRVNNGTVVTSTPVASGSDSDSGLTTSIVYTTQVHTVTSCASTVTNCPVGSVTTKTVALYTTVCPVTAAEATSTGASSGSSSGSSDSGSETITEVVTQVHTITSCASTVTNCPATLSTEYITTTRTPSVTQTPSSGSESSGSESSGSESDSSESDSDSSGASSSGFWPSAAPAATGYQTPGADSTPAAGEAPAETPIAAETPVQTPGGSYETPAAGSTPVATPVVGSDSGSGSYSSASGFTPVATPATTPGAATSASSSSSETEAAVTAGATKMGASLALVLGAVAAMMI